VRLDLEERLAGQPLDVAPLEVVVADAGAGDDPERGLHPMALQDRNGVQHVLPAVVEGQNDGLARRRALAPHHRDELVERQRLVAARARCCICSSNRSSAITVSPGGRPSVAISW
jgi:hypothetical protein